MSRYSNDTEENESGRRQAERRLALAIRKYHNSRRNVDMAWIEAIRPIVEDRLRSERLERSGLDNYDNGHADQVEE